MAHTAIDWLTLISHGKMLQNYQENANSSISGKIFVKRMLMKEDTLRKQQVDKPMARNKVGFNGGLYLIPGQDKK